MQYLVFAGDKIINENIKFCNQTLQRSSSVKYLGVITDPTLTWRDHISHIHIKIARSSGVLHKVQHILPLESFKTLYYTLLYPYLQYCNVVWGMANKTTLNKKMNKIIMQKRLIRLLAKVKYHEHTALIFKALGILSIVNIHWLVSLKFIQEHLQTTYFFVIPTFSEIHNVNTRNGMNIRLCFPKTGTLKIYNLVQM